MMNDNNDFEKNKIRETINETKTKAEETMPPMDWNNVMERSEEVTLEPTNISYFERNKYKILSTAASLLLIIALSAFALIAAFDSSPKQRVKTVDSTQSSIATTTMPEESTTIVEESTTTTTATTKPKGATTTKPVVPGCYKSTDNNCGPVVQEGTLKKPTLSVSNFQVWGNSVYDSYPDNGITMTYDVHVDNIVNSDTGIYSQFLDQYACVEMDVQRIGGPTYRAIACEDSVKYFSYSGWGSDLNNWNLSCSGAADRDPRRGTWPEPTYKSSDYDQGGYFAGPTPGDGESAFPAGNYKVTLRQWSSNCGGQILAGPTNVTISN